MRCGNGETVHTSVPAPPRSRGCDAAPATCQAQPDPTATDALDLTIRGQVRCESAPHRARFQHSILDYTLLLYDCTVLPHLIDAIFHERRWADGQSCRDVLIEPVRGAGTGEGCNHSSRRSNGQRHHLAAQGRNAAAWPPGAEGRPILQQRLAADFRTWRRP